VVQRAARLGGERGQQQRDLDAHTARDVDEGAAAPAGLVGRDEHVARLERDDRAQVRLDELGMALDRLAQRHHDRPVLDRHAIAGGVVDLQELDRALGRLEQSRGRGVQRALPGRPEGVEREVAEVGELPARAALPLRQAECGDARGGLFPARDEPLGLGERDVSQSSPPSGAR
jgi:hypothetical protein